MQFFPVHKIFKGVRLTKKEIHIIKNTMKERSVSQGYNLLDPRDHERLLYYVSSGCLRTYFTDSSGKEHTLQFATEDSWITDYEAFLANDKPVLNIDCVEDAVLYELSKEGLGALYSQIPHLEKFFRANFEKSLISFQKRILSSMVRSATVRYKRFISTEPDIADAIKNYYIASYLGLAPESLSRLKKNLARE